MAIVFHLLNAAKLLIVADALFSWVMNDNQFPRSVTKAVLEPVYAPLRSMFGAQIGRVDLSPFAALGVIYLIDVLLTRTGNRAPR